MPTVIELDFQGAPPAQGGSQVDHIPVGRYPLRVERVESGTTATGKRRVIVNFKVAAGSSNGSRLRDQFVLPAKPDDSKFGLQRLNAFFLACGANVGEKKVKIDLDTFIGRNVAADVEDNTIPANNDYPERTVSAPIAYYPIAILSEKPVAAQPSSAAPAPVAESSAPVTPVQATLPESKPEKDVVAEMADSIESLFT